MDSEDMFKTSPAKSEYVTRKAIIDATLKAAGWSVVNHSGRMEARPRNP